MLIRRKITVKEAVKRLNEAGMKISVSSVRQGYLKRLGIETIRIEGVQKVYVYERTVDALVKRFQEA